MKVIPFRTHIAKMECQPTVKEWLRAVWLIVVILAATLVGFAVLVGILVLITRPAHAQVSFPQHPTEQQIFWNGAFKYVWHNGSWSLSSYRPGLPLPMAVFADCRGKSHFHPKGMDTSQPDVKGAPKPKPDGLCHSDKSDQVVK